MSEEVTKEKPEDFASPAPLPADVHLFGAYIRGLKLSMHSARLNLKEIREEIKEIEDEERATILEARLPQTQKQKDTGVPGSLQYSNDTSRELALREVLRTHEEYGELRDREQAWAKIVAELEAYLSQARRDFPVLLIDYLKEQPVNVQACFASLQFLMTDYNS